MLCSWRTGSRTSFRKGSDDTPVKSKAFSYRDGFLARDLTRVSGKGCCFNVCTTQRNETAVDDCFWGLSHTMLSSFFTNFHFPKFGVPNLIYVGLWHTFHFVRFNISVFRGRDKMKDSGTEWRRALPECNRPIILLWFLNLSDS